MPKIIGIAIISFMEITKKMIFASLGKVTFLAVLKALSRIELTIFRLKA